jgi:hypothetical protein
MKLDETNYVTLELSSENEEFHPVLVARRGAQIPAMCTTTESFQSSNLIQLVD